MIEKYNVNTIIIALKLSGFVLWQISKNEEGANNVNVCIFLLFKTNIPNRSTNINAFPSL